MMTRVQILRFLLLLWSLVMIWSLLTLRLTDILGRAGPFSGLDGLTTFLVLQLVAGCLAMICFKIGTTLPQELRLRRYSRLPMAGLMLLGVAFIAAVGMALPNVS